MKPFLRQAGALAACLALSCPAFASDRALPMHAEHFERALQQQRFDEAAAMFTPAQGRAPAATAAQLKRIAARLGGFTTMHQVPSLPNGATLKFELPSAAPLAPRPARYYQKNYKATAADGQPVFYVLTLAGTLPQPVLWFELHLPTPDAASTERARQALKDILQ